MSEWKTRKEEFVSPIKYLPEIYENVIELRKNNITLKEISNELNISIDTIRNWIYRNQVPISIRTKKILLAKKTHSFFYLLGVYYGDGWINGNRTFGLVVKDYDFIKEFSKSSMEWCKILPKYKYLEKRGLHSARIYSSIVCYLIKCFNIKLLEAESTKNKVTFLRGLYDSEGSAHIGKQPNGQRRKTPEISFVNENKQLVDIVFNLLLSFNINPKIYSDKGSSFNPDGIYYRIRIFERESVINFFKLIGFSIKRKQNISKVLLEDRW
jgi:hypothetical protein